MGVEFTANGKTMKKMVKAIEHINEECIFTFDNTGMLVRMSDVYKHKMIELFIHRDTFQTYECNTPFAIGVVIDRIKDVTKTLSMKDEMSFEHKDDDSVITLKAKGLSRTVKLIDTNMIGVVPFLNLEHKYEFEMDSTPLKSFMKAASKTSNFDVLTASNNVTFLTETDEGGIDVNWSVENSFESETNYPTEALIKSTATMAGLINVKGDQNGVLQIHWDLDNNSYINALIAPRL
tara:strand:- start:1220 stop:1924 length:705 start_codon:yes stop_codon:yes gene_type:complete